jgi:hypothetical protein
MFTFYMELSVIVGFSLYRLGADCTEIRALPSNGYPLLLRICWNVFTYKQAVYQESVYAGRCLLSHYLAKGVLYVTVWPV